jgi:hypothetical protein
MVEYFQQPDNALFILIVFGLFVLDYILERIESRRLSHHHKPSMLGVLVGTIIVITVSELLLYLIKLLVTTNPIV